MCVLLYACVCILMYSLKCHGVYSALDLITNDRRQTIDRLETESIKESNRFSIKAMNRTGHQSGDIDFQDLTIQGNTSYFFETLTDSQCKRSAFCQSKNRYDESVRSIFQFSRGFVPTIICGPTSDLLGNHASRPFAHKVERWSCFWAARAARDARILSLAWTHSSGPLRSLPRSLFPGDIQHPREREHPFGAIELGSPGGSNRQAEHVRSRVWV